MLETHTKEFNKKQRSVATNVTEIMKKKEEDSSEAVTEELREGTLLEVTALETNFGKLLGISRKTS